MGAHGKVLEVSSRRSRREQGRSGRRNSDRNPDFDANRGRVRPADAITKAVAMGDPWRHQHLYGMAHEGMAGAATGKTRLGPGLAPAAAHATHPSERDIDGYHSASERFSPRKRHFRFERFRGLRLAKEGVARALDEPLHGREIDGDLVGKAVGRGLTRAHRLSSGVDSG